MNTRGRLAVAALGVAALTPLMPVQPAAAGTNSASWTCDITPAYHMYSGANYKQPASASTSDSWDNVCGTMGVRMQYRLYIRSPAYWSSWNYGSTYASVSPGNIGTYSEHYMSGYTIWPAQTNPLSTR